MVPESEPDLFAKSSLFLFCYTLSFEGTIKRHIAAALGEYLIKKSWLTSHSLLIFASFLLICSAFITESSTCKGSFREPLTGWSIWAWGGHGWGLGVNFDWEKVTYNKGRDRRGWRRQPAWRWICRAQVWVGVQAGMNIAVFGPSVLGSLQLSKYIFIICFAYIKHCATCWETKDENGRECKTIRSPV